VYPYLTIEYKGVIPRQLRSKIGNHIFGCEVCQSVCPYNQRILAVDPGILSPLLEPKVDLLREIGISAREYAEKFARTPILRANWESYRRNVIIAMETAARTSTCLSLRKSCLAIPPAFAAACRLGYWQNRWKKLNSNPEKCT
jgi:epoxyqueuosine reductase